MYAVFFTRVSFDNAAIRIYLLTENSHQQATRHDRDGVGPIWAKPIDLRIAV